MSTFPTPLQPGDTIGVMAPSSHVAKNDMDQAQKIIEGLGYNVFVHPQTFSKLGQSAGSAEEKAGALHDLFSNPDIKAVIAAIGGNRASLMLDKIDYDLIKQNPKPFLGYSDVTVLLNAIYTHTDMITYHGPACSTLSRLEPQWHKMALDSLSGKVTSFSLNDAVAIQNGEATGHLIGGNLSTFQSLVGTPYMPSPKDAILFLEDVNDHISRYDRMLRHLSMAGILQNIAGLIIGEFLNTQDNPKNPFGFTMEEIVQEHTKGLNIPIVMNAPFGHGDNQTTFPVGAPIKLTASEETVSLEIT
ncbi:MAG: LD-carboxypeptidase [Pseudomonadota bacterium]